MSATPISLGENCTDINFTDGSVTTYIDPTPPLPNCNNPVEPMLQLPNGLYALYAGNVTCDNVIRATGPLTVNDFQQIFNFLGTNLFVPSVYSVFDINMDGSVRRSGPLAINDAQLFKSFIVRPINIICQHMP